MTVDTVAILGLGLIGGSLARALREAQFCRQVIGYGRREPSLAKGKELGVIDEYSLELAAVVQRADIVVIAAPTLVAADMLKQILPMTVRLAEPPVVTDVASVKGNLRSAAIAAVGSVPNHVVFGHPIAGSEQSGVAASRADLFVNHRVILTPEADTDPQALATVRAMWACTQAEVVDMDISRHDAVLAATSHLPHVLAYALVDALAQSSASEDIFRFAAGGFRDFTRIASSDPVMWRDISIANRDALLQAVDEFSEQLSTLRAAVATEDSEQLLSIFSRAKAARDQFAADMAARQS